MKDEDQIKIVSDNLLCPKGEKGEEIGLKMNVSNLELMNESIKVLDLERGDNVIEIGLGNGKLSFPILDSIGDNGRYIGVDISQTMIDEAQKSISNYWEGNFSLFKGELHELSLEHKFNKLISVNVLYFISDIESFFLSIKDKLSKGAKVVIGIRSSETLSQLPIAKYNFILRSKNEIIQVLEKLGFYNIEDLSFIESKRVERQVDTDIEFENFIFSFNV